ncbi:hypothetical protein ACJX0J_012622, partial [Zea mays]
NAIGARCIPFFTHILVFEVLDAIETVAVPVIIIYTTPLSAENLNPIASKHHHHEHENNQKTTLDPQQLIYQLPFSFTLILPGRVCSTRNKELVAFLCGRRKVQQIFSIAGNTAQKQIFLAFNHNGVV